MRDGLISIRLADTLLYLPPEEQLLQLKRRLAAAEEWERRSQLAAQTIRRYLDSAERIDLGELQCRIRNELTSLRAAAF
jgi:hypothetical protein